MPSKYRRLPRRQFLAAASTVSAFVAIRTCVSAQNLPPESRAPAAKVVVPRILSLALTSSASLAEMKEFYHRTLGLPVLEEKADRLTIGAGKTRIAFSPEKGDRKPFYHFAFNIPENKVLAAHRWQIQRTPLLPIPRTLRDPQYPDDVVDYRHWNAHSIFFFDPAGNVVEYIGRHDLRNGAPGAFSSADILYASEIALVVDDVNVLHSSSRRNSHSVYTRPRQQEAN